MKMQIIDFQELACAREGRADRIGRKGENLRSYTRHRLDDCNCFGWKIAENIITLLLFRIFHVAYPYAVDVVIFPLDASDLLLPARAEDCKSQYFVHRQREWSVAAHHFKMFHDAVEFGESGSAVP